MGDKINCTTEGTYLLGLECHEISLRDFLEMFLLFGTHQYDVTDDDARWQIENPVNRLITS